jgi:rSAM/selenodomain-associated transferase 2/rSAM/selenodomain-associated transferase 1
MLSPATVSVVIPVVRDHETLRTTLTSLDRTAAGALRRGAAAGTQLSGVVVAGVASETASLEEVCGPYPRVRVVAARPGRARQMNAGAAHATGRWVLFLHADSQPDPGWLEEIARADASGATWGCFQLGLDAATLPARLVEWWVRGRVRLARLPYGDQGLFVRRDLFERMGGYADLPLMEDVELVDRLRRAEPMHASRVRVTTSARRWRRDGWVRRSLSNNALLTLYRLGAPPAWLARRYAGRRPLALVVLARAPSSPGKSRLWRELGVAPDPALRRALLVDTCAAAGVLARADLYVVTSPPSSSGEIAGLVPSAHVLAQRGDDLGARMHAAFDDVFGLGYRGVVLIGSDLPTVPSAILASAFDCLSRGTTDVVLGPSEDGGYFLVGLRRPVPEIFTGIEWSRPDVFERTLAAAAAATLRVARVPAWYDVDDVTSLRRAAEDAGRAPLVHAWWTRHIR